MNKKMKKDYLKLMNSQMNINKKLLTKLIVMTQILDKNKIIIIST